MITAQIKLDTFRENNIPILKIPQGDYLGRELKVFITALGERIKLSTSDAVTVTALRSDGASKNFTGMVDVSDGSALIPIERWMLDVEGDVECWVSVLRGDSKYSTNRFLIEVQYSPGAETSGELDLTPEDQVVVEINAKIDALDSALNALAFDLRVTNSNMNAADEELNAKINSASEKITDVENDLDVHERKTGAKISALEEKEEADYRANRLISVELIRPYANSGRALVLKKEDLDQVFSLVTFPVYENGTEFIKGRMPMFLKWYDVEEAAFRSYDLEQSCKVSRGYDETNEYYSIKFLYGDAVLYDGPGYDFYFTEHSKTNYLQPVVVDEDGNYISSLNVVGSSLYSGVFDTDNLPNSSLSVNTADVYRYTYADGNYRDFMLVPEGRTELAQEPGDSETKVMSQKAVTELANKNFDTYKSTNRLDMSKVTIGKYIPADGKIREAESNKYTDYIPVTPGEKITFQARYYANNVGVGRYLMGINFIAAYDSEKNIIESAGRNGNTTEPYVVPEGVSYIICSITSTMTFDETTFAGVGDQAIVASDVVIPYEEYYEPVSVLKRECHDVNYIKELIEEATPETQESYSWLTVFLPDEIVCAAGRTIEIYNSQVCPLADRFHFRWDCSVGKALKRKFSVEGTDALIGSYDLKLYIYNDQNEQIFYKSAALKIVGNTITTDVSICPIGDSLSNGKYWLDEVRTLSADKVSFVGTRGSVEGKKHEGRSGWSTNQYLMAKEYDYEGEGIHPFWDTANSRFSWSYYKTNTGLNPSAVQLFLGTNELSWEASDVFAANMKRLVDEIRTDDSSVPIFIVMTLCWGNQNGIGVQTSNDGFASQKGKYKYDLDLKTISGVKAMYEALKDYLNVYFIPLTQCHDSEYNFGAIETPVNPRATQTELMPTEAVHPKQQGYEQFADIMYSVYCQAFGGNG